MNFYSDRKFEICSFSRSRGILLCTTLGSLFYSTELLNEWETNRKSPDITRAVPSRLLSTYRNYCLTTLTRIKSMHVGYVSTLQYFLISILALVVTSQPGL